MPVAPPRENPIAGLLVAGAIFAHEAGQLLELAYSHPNLKLYLYHKESETNIMRYLSGEDVITYFSDYRYYMTNDGFQCAFKLALPYTTENQASTDMHVLKLEKKPLPAPRAFFQDLVNLMVVTVNDATDTRNVTIHNIETAVQALLKKQNITTLDDLIKERERESSNEDTTTRTALLKQSDELLFNVCLETLTNCITSEDGRLTFIEPNSDAEILLTAMVNDQWIPRFDFAHIKTVYDLFGFSIRQQSFLGVKQSLTIEPLTIEIPIEGRARENASHAVNLSNEEYAMLGLSRMAMRHPDSEVKTQLQNLHQTIKKLFEGCSDAEINWLLGGAPNSRGSFTNHEAFKRFFAIDPKTIASSRLITALESVVTCIAYRAINRTDATTPISPSQTEPEHKMYALIHQLMDSKMSPEFSTISIRKALETKTQEYFISIDQIPRGTSIKTNPVQTSDVSDDEEPNRRLPLRKPNFFQNVLVGTKKTWAGSAVAARVPIREHVSRSAPPVLSVLSVLLGEWFKVDDNVKKFSGAILIPVYLRGDYHTVAETALGVIHFLENRQGRLCEMLPPQECLARGLSFICMGIEESKRESANEIAHSVLVKVNETPVANTNLTSEEVRNLITACLAATENKVDKKSFVDLIELAFKLIEVNHANSPVVEQYELYNQLQTCFTGQTAEELLNHFSECDEYQENRLKALMHTLRTRITEIAEQITQSPPL